MRDLGLGYISLAANGLEWLGLPLDMMPVWYVMLTVILSLPQLLIAWTGGLLARRVPWAGVISDLLWKRGERKARSLAANP